MTNSFLNRAKTWLNDNYDVETQKQVQYLIDNEPKELEDAFYRDLEFGTGGLRGIMGVGTNRMNKYTVGAATQGLANYLKRNFRHLDGIKVAIAHDCRNNSRFFAETTANIFSANGFTVYLFEDLRPTPELSFAVRHFGCQSGVVVTASHNPKEYNGYKAYWDDGAQVVSPHDTNIIEEVTKITEISQIKFEGNPNKIIALGNDFDTLYIDKLKGLSISPEAIERQKDMKIVYTPIHGTGVKLVPETLKAYGFQNVIHVPEQDVNDGNFPTVNSPNPENADALQMAIDKAEAVGAELVLATDPDADRVGIAVRDNSGKFVLLNGNQTASVLIYYLIKKRVEAKMLKGNEYIVKTIVTTDLLNAIAQKFSVEYFDTLTGFKYIAEIIGQNEGKKLFIGGGEESYGYLAGEFVRDKDAVMAAALIAEAAAYAKDNNMSFYEQLIDIYVEFGLYQEGLVNVVKKGKDGAEAIKQMMVDYRANPPKTINGSKVIELKDYQTSVCDNFVAKTVEPLNFPKSDVLQFFTEDGAKITVRPSGTEPKIKFYISVNTTLDKKENYHAKQAELQARINAIIADMGLK